MNSTDKLIDLTQAENESLGTKLLDLYDGEKLGVVNNLIDELHSAVEDGDQERIKAEIDALQRYYKTVKDFIQVLYGDKEDEDRPSKKRRMNSNT